MYVQVSERQECLSSTVDHIITELLKIHFGNFSYCETEMDYTKRFIMTLIHSKVQEVTLKTTNSVEDLNASDSSNKNEIQGASLNSLSTVAINREENSSVTTLSSQMEKVVL